MVLLVGVFVVGETVRGEGEGKGTGWARRTAWLPASALMREKGRKALSVRTYTPCTKARVSGTGRKGSGSREEVGTHPMVRLEVVDLLPEHQRPQVLTEELDDVERVVEPRPVAREPATSLR